ncbi:MAG: vWA domain-containing protein [Methanothrix sp.]
MESWSWARVWQRSRRNWHWPLLPPPRLALQGAGAAKQRGEFPFSNYQITLDQKTLSLGPLYLEGLFDHLIAHYVFCPRSLDEAALLARSALEGLKSPDPDRSRALVNIFSDIIVDSLRLERSLEDREKVLLGWQRLAEQPDLMPLDRVVLGLLRRYWEAELPASDRPEISLLERIFSAGFRDRSLWPRQCRQMARILEPLLPGILGRGPVRCQEILNGCAHALPLAGAEELEPGQYNLVLTALGLEGDQVRWYRDQSYSITIREAPRSRSEEHPSAPQRWRLTDPCSELDVAYSLSLSPRLIPGVTTYKRGREKGLMAPLGEAVPDLLVILDSSRSMEGHRRGSKTHRATLAAFKACRYAHSKGAMVAAINFSERYLAVPWTRDLAAVERALVEFFSTRTHIPGKAIRALAEQRPGCLILCITDTHIQNLYQEWDNIERAARASSFALFCIDQDYKDQQVEGALAGLGRVYYINRLEDLVSMVVEVTGRAYSGESFIS